MPKQTAKNRTIDTLMKFGLGENEALLYTIMLRHPRSTVRELETRAPFPRTMLYYVLNQLIQAGLVSAVKERWRTVYIAENPERLYDVLGDREREFAGDVQALRELIPELKTKYRLADKRPNVRLLEGVDGYKKALDEMLLASGEMIRAYADMGGKKPGLEARESHEQRRIRKRLQKRVLLFDSPAARTALKKRPYDDATQFRFISNRLEAFAVDLQLYAGRILYTTRVDREPVAIVIEDQMLFTMQERIFDSLWEEAKDATLLSFTK